jgi:hypothetical protein
LEVGFLKPLFGVPESLFSYRVVAAKRLDIDLRDRRLLAPVDRRVNPLVGGQIVADLLRGEECRVTVNLLPTPCELPQIARRCPMRQRQAADPLRARHGQADRDNL